MVYLCNRQIKMRQYFILAYIHVAIPYRTAKFKSANIFAIAIWGPTAKFNSRQYFRLYGTSMVIGAKAWPKTEKKKKKFIHLPYLPSRGWNAGKSDCGHYRSHLGFSILMGRGFTEVGGWLREEPGDS